MAAASEIRRELTLPGATDLLVLRDLEQVLAGVVARLAEVGEREMTGVRRRHQPLRRAGRAAHDVAPAAVPA